jgi:hypothetical protein
VTRRPPGRERTGTDGGEQRPLSGAGIEHAKQNDERAYRGRGMARVDRAARLRRTRGWWKYGDAVGPMHAVPHTLLLGPSGRQLTDTMIEHRSLAPSPLGVGRDGEGRSGSKGGEGPASGGNRFPRAPLPAGPGPPAVPRIVARRVARCTRRLMHNGCLTHSYLAVGWSVTNTCLTIALWPVCPLGQGGVAR